MAIVIFLVVFFVGIPLIAARIVAGWILPAPTLRAVDHFVYRAIVLAFQLGIVGLAGLIIYVIWLSN